MTSSSELESSSEEESSESSSDDDSSSDSSSSSSDSDSDSSFADAFVGAFADAAVGAFDDVPFAGVAVGAALGNSFFGVCAEPFARIEDMSRTHQRSHLICLRLPFPSTDVFVASFPEEIGGPFAIK